MTTSALPEHLGRYRVVRELGRGAMGVVYEGQDPAIGRRVAIKTARADVLASSGRAEEMMERFLREARAAGVLNHPNIVTIYDVGEEAGTAYIAMEYLEGMDLAKVLREKRRMPNTRVVEIAATVCRALHHAHAHGIIHRDVKPANIVRRNDGTICVTDFGIAHVSDSSLTQEGTIIGTPHYMSPEQFLGQHLDGRSDLFSVGVIAYELLTGDKPFAGETLSGIMHRVLHEDPIPPRSLNVTLGEALNQVVLKALAKSPEDRYQDGEAMAEALMACMGPTVLTSTVRAREEVADETVTADAPTVQGVTPAIRAEAPTLRAETPTVAGAATLSTSDAATPTAVSSVAATVAKAPTQTPDDVALAPTVPLAPATRPRRTVLRAGLGAAVVVALLAGGYALTIGRGSGGDIGAPKAQSPYFSGAHVQLYAYDNPLDIGDTAKARPGKARVRIETPGTTAPLLDAIVDGSKTLALPADATPSELRVTADGADYGLETVAETYFARAPGETADIAMELTRR